MQTDLANTLQTHNMEEYKINSEFFLSKFDRPDLEESRKEVSAKYLGATSENRDLRPPLFSLKEVIEKIKSEGKLPPADFKYKYPEIDVKDVPKVWGFPLDPKIADLVITLNRLGMITASACEGHRSERGELFPEVSFWNEEFYKVVAHLVDWDELDGDIIIRSTLTGYKKAKYKMFDILFFARDLEESQKLVQRLVDYLKSKAG